MISLDATTLSSYLAASTADARAQAVIDSLSGTVYVRVYDGANTLMGEGTMAAPWATRSGSVITVGEVTSFSVLQSGTPNAASWYLRFETAGGRWVRGPFGAGGNFTWSLGSTWNAGQSGSLGTVTLNAKGTIALVGAAIAQAAGSAGLTVSGGGSAFFTDGFESADFSHAEGGARWTSVSGGITVSATNPIEGSRSARVLYVASDQNADDMQELYFDLGRSIPEVWIRFLLRIPAGFYHRDVPGSDNNKLLKLGSHYDGGSTQGVNLIWEYWPTGDGSSELAFHWTVIGVDTGAHLQSTRTWGPAEAGTVQEIIFHAKMSSGFGVNDGLIQCWHKPAGGSFTRIHHYTTAPLYPQVSEAAQNVWKGGYIFGWCNSSYAADTIFGLDGVQFSETNLWGVS